MSRFFIGLIVAFLLCSVAWVTGIQQQRDVPTAMSRWVFDAYQLKTRAAQTTTGQRILILAGSNALFGIDSGLLESTWQRPVVNLSLNAGLGLPYILDFSRHVARAGDIVLLPIEYGLYLDNGSPRTQFIDYVLARDPAYLDRMETIDRMHFMAKLSPERWIHGLRRLPDHPVDSGTYGIHHMDRRGDQTHTALDGRTSAETQDLQTAARKIHNYGFRALNESGSWKILENYSRWAKEHHICLLAVPSALLGHTEYVSDPVERNFYETLPDRIRATGIPYYGKPLDFMYPADRFFNTEYHLESHARTKHTTGLIDSLGQHPDQLCQPR
jgi:hypothetical protein